MMKKKNMSIVAGFLSVMLFIFCTGCEFKTTVISDADMPDVTLENFFAELKAKNYKGCDKYLADNATFVVNNDTDYGFMEDLMDLEMDKLNYQLVSQPIVDGVNASQMVKITALDVDDMVEFMKKNITSIEHDYINDTSQSDFDKDNKYAVSDVMRVAMEKYAKNADTVENTITVSFKFHDNSWKIVVDSSLTAAIFGGSADE
jgi:hypothetical protein